MNENYNSRNNTATVLWVLLIIIILAIGAYFIWGTGSAAGTSGAATTTTTGTTGTGDSGVTQELTTNEGVTISYDPSVWGLAANASQLPTNSNIPPCGAGFDYCFYLDNGAYAGTNFQSAGLALTSRPDLTTQSACLTTEPAGYTGQTSEQTTGTGYMLATFAPLGSAAAGSSSAGALYRLYYGTTCYEFQAQVGQGDYGNYSPGTIQQFTAADEAGVASDITHLLSTVTINAGTPVAFPAFTAGGS